MDDKGFNVLRELRCTSAPCYKSKLKLAMASGGCTRLVPRILISHHIHRHDPMIKGVRPGGACSSGFLSGSLPGWFPGASVHFAWLDVLGCLCGF